MQRPVNHGMMDPAAHLLLLGGLYRGHHEHTALGGLFEKRSEQFLFLLASQVLVMTAPDGFAPQHGLAVAQVVGLHLPYRVNLPTYRGRNLGRG